LQDFFSKARCASPLRIAPFFLVLFSQHQQVQGSVYRAGLLTGIDTVNQAPPPFSPPWFAPIVDDPFGRELVFVFSLLFQGVSVTLFAQSPQGRFENGGLFFRKKNFWLFADFFHETLGKGEFFFGGESVPFTPPTRDHSASNLKDGLVPTRAGSKCSPLLREIFFFFPLLLPSLPSPVKKTAPTPFKFFYPS